MLRYVLYKQLHFHILLQYMGSRFAVQDRGEERARCATSPEQPDVMTETKIDHQIGGGERPKGTRSKKGQSGLAKRAPPVYPRPNS